MYNDTRMYGHSLKKQTTQTSRPAFVTLESTLELFSYHRIQGLAPCCAVICSYKQCRSEIPS